jgi:hypothetical protein
MYFTQFKKSLKTGIAESIRSFGSLIEKTTEGSILIDGEETKFKELEEARIFVKNKHYSENLEKEVAQEIYEEMSESRIATIIKEYYDIKVTEQLIESYVELASSKLFTVDPVVQKIRALNKLDSIIENKLDYVLADGTVVAINEETQQELNNLLANNLEVVEYMRESKNNFFYVINKIKE